MKKNSLANYFYEQCCGAVGGKDHPIVPHNPALFVLIKSMGGALNLEKRYSHAASKSQFAGILRELAEDLEQDP